MQSETSENRNTVESEVEVANETLHEENESVHIVIDVVEEGPSHGQYIGQCKWFNDLLGYGFLTICVGDESGKDIFVHHTGIKPLNSNYRTLKKGEYLSFNIVNGVNGLQATDVTGINGGPLMCDFVSTTRRPRVNTQSTVIQTQHPQGSNAPPVYSFNPRYQRYNYTPSSQQARHVSGNNFTRPDSWYVVTKSGRRKNLAKYSKEGRMAMKSASETQQSS